MLGFTVSSGTKAPLNLTLPIYCIISMWLFHISFKSSDILSSQDRPLLTKVCRFNIIVAVIGVIFPVKSNTSATFDTHCLLVRWNGMVFLPCTVFLPLSFFAKFNSPISKDSISSLGNHFIPAMLILQSPVWQFDWKITFAENDSF